MTTYETIDRAALAAVPAASIGLRVRVEDATGRIVEGRLETISNLSDALGVGNALVREPVRIEVAR